MQVSVEVLCQRSVLDSLLGHKLEQSKNKSKYGNKYWNQIASLGANRNKIRVN